MGPLLFVSYSGAFGGAERVLLDCAHAVAAEPCLACPEGPLADRARAAGLTVLTIPGRRPNLRATGRDRLFALTRLVAHGRELRSIAAELDACAVVVWGMRSAIAGLALPADTPLAIAHQDLLPGRRRRPPCASLFGGPASSSFPRARLLAISIPPGGWANGCGSSTRASSSNASPPSTLRRRRPRSCCWARSSRGSDPTLRSRPLRWRGAGFPNSVCDSSVRPCRARTM